MKHNIEDTIREDDEVREWKHQNFLKSILGTPKAKQSNYSEDEVIFELEIKGRRVS